ncbi:MAG: sugar-binding transcriptional regulator [Eubacterium sp.]|nr:sugar-binding transcriptional regulator [Eubacterium sp.]
MKKVIDDVRLMVKACDLYYNQSVSQQQIAAELGISRPTVSRLLTQARDQGIVEIRISYLDSIRYWELERQLEKDLGLKRVLIVDTFEDDDRQKDELGKMTASFLKQVIHDDDVVGVSMGSTLARAVEHMDHPQAKNVTFVPLVGGTGLLRTELHSNTLAEKLSQIYGGSYIPMHAPARVTNKTLREELMKEDGVAAVLRRTRNLDVAVMGIGYPSSGSALMATGYFSEKEIRGLKNREIAGDVCMQFFDIQGNSRPYREDNSVIGVDIQRLPKVPVSIGTAGGIEKLSAIRGAINGKYINILITDLSCARALAGEEDHTH